MGFPVLVRCSRSSHRRLRLRSKTSILRISSNTRFHPVLIVASSEFPTDLRPDTSPIRAAIDSSRDTTLVGCMNDVPKKPWTSLHTN